jgi:hypothetical protein
MRRVLPAASTRTLQLGLVLTGVLCVAAQPSTTRAITLNIQAGAGVPGGSVQAQVFLTGGNGLVAGVQTDIAWDSTCLSAVPGDGDAAECDVNPAIRKQLSTRIRNPSTLRAVYLSMSDVKPIQEDTWLFSCQFTIDPATTARQCVISLVNVILSDSQGGRLPATAGATMVQINQSNAPSAPVQRAPLQAPAVVIQGGGGGGPSGGGTTGAVTGGQRGGGGIVAPGLPAEQAPTAEEAAGAAPQAETTPAQRTPSPGRTVAVATTPSPGAGTPKVSARTPTPHATVPRGTPTRHSGTPGSPKPTPKP